MSNIFITGATGLLGSHLAVSLAAQGHNLRLTKRSKSNIDNFTAVCHLYGLAESAKYDWVNADILNYEALEEAMEGIDAVFHCAAMVSFWNRRHTEMYDINVIGTANIVNAALVRGVKYFGHVSSIAALGRSEATQHLTEESQWTESRFNTAYARTKYLSELEVWRGFAEGLQGSIINPGVILGEGNWAEGSMKIARSAANGFPFYPVGKNGYVDVKDCVRAWIKLWEKNVMNERFIMVEGSYGLRDVLSQFAKHFGKKPPFIQVPSWLSVTAAQFLQLYSNTISQREPLVSPETAANSGASFIYANDKIRQQLGFEFTPLTETVRRVAEFYEKV